MTKKRLSYQETNLVEKLNQTKLETQMMEEEFQFGLALVDRARKERARVVKELENEHDYQEQLRAKIDNLKGQYKVYESSKKAHQDIYQELRAKRPALEQKLADIDKAIHSKKKSNKIIKNNFPKLIHEINTPQGFPKEKSIFINCLQALIQATQANEFDGYTWRAKIDRTAKWMGARIQFSGLAIHKFDLPYVYEELTQSFQKKFKSSNLKIVMNTKRNGAIITDVDFVLTLPLSVAFRNLELP